MKNGLGVIAIAFALTLTGCTKYQDALATYSTPAGETSTAQDPEETPEPEKPKKTEKAEPTPDIAGDIEKTALEANGVDSFTELGTTSPAYAFTSFDTLNADTIRVHVQDTLTDKAAEHAALWLINMTCATVDVSTVVVRDTSGVDRNFYRGKLAAIPACQ